MSHFAKVIGGVVVEVLVIEQDVIDTGMFGDPSLFMQTSYNTRGGQHPEGRPLRKNFAGIGYTYDAERDAFIPPQPFPSWLLDEETCLWLAPAPYPEDGNAYAWDEEALSWVDPASYAPAPVVVAPAVVEPVIAEPEAPDIEVVLSTVASSVGGQ